MFTNQKNIDDKKFISNWNKEHGKGINDRELSKILNEKKFTNFELIKGDVKKTIPKYLKKNKHTKIALLHLDMDVYQPTIAALKYFYKLMSNNGIILIDDYAVEVGATKAIDYFRNKKVEIKKKLVTTTIVLTLYARKNLKILIVIPARKNSKRLPNKNLLKVNKKSLIQRTIDIAKQITDKENIIISTDSSKIQKIAKQNQINVPWLRPKKTFF